MSNMRTGSSEARAGGTSDLSVVDRRWPVK